MQGFALFYHPLENQCRRFRRVLVLNALRHQRFRHEILVMTMNQNIACSTPYGIKGSGTSHGSSKSDVVLPCSTPYGIKGSGTTPITVTFLLRRCAQRLTASKVPALFHKEISMFVKLVLNALRHQRFRHYLPKNVFFILGKVLNALRHQRFRHMEIMLPLDRRMVCSTPYGIKGSGTPRGANSLI